MIWWSIFWVRDGSEKNQYQGLTSNMEEIPIWGLKWRFMIGDVPTFVFMPFMNAHHLDSILVLLTNGCYMIWLQEEGKQLQPRHRRDRQEVIKPLNFWFLIMKTKQIHCPLFLFFFLYFLCVWVVSYFWQLRWDLCDGCSGSRAWREVQVRC